MKKDFRDVSARELTTRSARKGVKEDPWDISARMYAESGGPTDALRQLMTQGTISMAVPKAEQAQTGMIKVASFDPAMRNWGMAKLLIDPDSNTIKVVDMRLIVTVSEAGKTVRKSSDDLRRASVSYNSALEYALWADVIFAEVPSGSQSSRASLGAGMSIMALAALGFVRPLIQVSPVEAKRAVTGRSTASKDEMIEWAVARHPDAPWLRKKVKGVISLIDANEHMADALAIAQAGVLTAEFRSAVSMMGSLNRTASLLQVA